jgi:glucan biosynthesis protein C
VGDQPTIRYYELDWLRVYVIFGSISYHIMIGIQTFSSGARSNIVLRSMTNFLDLWGMPLLFCISGASAWFALERRATGRYLYERLVRLGLPFLAGILLVIPPEDYIGMRLDPHFQQAFPAYFATKVQQYTTLFQGNAFDNLITFWGHLWFIPELLLFAIITLPLFLWLKSAQGSWLWLRCSGVCAHPPGIFIAGLFFPLGEAVRQLVLPPAFGAYVQPMEFYFFSFIVGFMFYSDVRILRAIYDVGPTALLLGTMLFFGYEWLVYHVQVSSVATRLVQECLAAYVVWLWIVAILSVGMRYFTAPNAALTYWKDASFAFYVFHILAFAVVGFFIVQSPLPVVVQVLIIVPGGLFFLTVLYDQVIRRSNLLRALFGLGPLPRDERRADASYLVQWAKSVLLRAEKAPASESTP